MSDQPVTVLETCAWCEEATGELVVPGARGAYVHPSCEAKRLGRRSLLVGAALAAGAAALAPVLALVPEAAPSGVVTITAIDYVEGIVTVNITPSAIEAVRPDLVRIFEDASRFAVPDARRLRLGDRVRIDLLCPPDRAYARFA